MQRRTTEPTNANTDASEWPDNLAQRHRDLLIASGIKPRVASLRGYFTTETAPEIREWGHRRRDLDPHGLGIPIHNVNGKQEYVQFRPDNPPVTENGKVRKYLLPTGSRNVLDVHPLILDRLRDPNGGPIHFVEGARKVDSIISAGGVAIGLIGVYSFMGRNSRGGKTVLADFAEIALEDREVFITFDSDVATNPNVARAARTFAGILIRRGARVRHTLLPCGPDEVKWGADDYLAAGHTLSDLEALAVDETPYAARDGGAPLTETDVGRLFVSIHERVLRFCPERGRWLRWEETRWRWDIAEEHRELAKEVAASLSDSSDEEYAFRKRMLSGAGISSIGRLAQSDRRVVAHIDDLDSDPYTLNTPAGVVDLRTGSVGDHSPDDLCTKQTEYGATNEPCPRFDGFLDTTFGGDADLIAYVQRLLGYSLIGAVTEHVLPFAYGPGANGKSVLLDVAMGLLGTGEDGYAISASPSFLMSKAHKEHATEIARLHGARLVVCQEVGKEHSFDEPKLKQLTGGDRLAGRFMRRDYFTFRPTHHLWIAGNHQPTVSEGGLSFWRRLRLIPFEHVVPPAERNPYLAQELLDGEGLAILGWMIRGAVAMLTDGLSEPDAVTRATSEYELDEDSVTRFVQTCCERGGRDAMGFTVKGAKLREAYTAWCESAGFVPADAKAFTQRLGGHGVAVEHKRDGNYYTGIRLREVE